MDLTGKTALVTGAGIRLGRALASGLAGRGMRLALHYHRHGEEAEHLAESIRSSRPASTAPQAACFAADLEDPTSAARLMETAETVMGEIEVLVLSAALYPREPLEEIVPASLERTLRINLTTPFLLAREAGMRMKARGTGHIIAILDWSLDRPYIDRIPYTMAKAGLRAGVLGLARALAPEVRVNAVSPGAVLLADGVADELRERIAAASLLRRIGAPRDVVDAALYLLDSEFVTGTILTVDGGRTVV